MKAAIVQEAGKTPIYGDFREPALEKDKMRIAVTAAALSPLVKGRASGAHYSASTELPFVVGVDGVGRLDDGSRVYFALPAPPFGSMAEQVIVASSQCVPLPDDLDDITAAAIANPGMSSWAALSERAKLVAGETVLINGATGTAGNLAIQIAKYMGAKRVIATGRNAEALKALTALGADVTISISGTEEEQEAAFREQFSVQGVDIVLDYLWGRSAELILAAAAKAGRATPIRYVQIGSVSGGNITLPGAFLRASALELMGSGIGSVAPERLVYSIGELLLATVPGGFKIQARAVPLADVESAWNADDKAGRIVFTIDR